MRASRKRALRISTRCCQPTDRRPTFSSGSISKPNRYAEGPDALVRRVPIEEAALRQLVAELDVLGDRQDGNEHEVLVDHADPAIDRIRRAGDRDGRAVEQDLALIRGRQPVKDVHEGALAGTVLAEQGVNLAGPDVEVDPVVGEDARIALRDAAHLEREWFYRGRGNGTGVVSHARSAPGCSERAASEDTARSGGWP